MSPSLVGRKILNPSASRFGVCRTSFGVHRLMSSLQVFMWWETQKSMYGHLDRGMVPLMGAPAHDLTTTQTSHLLTPSIWGLGFQHMDFKEDTNIHSMTVSSLDSWINRHGAGTERMKGWFKAGERQVSCTEDMISKYWRESQCGGHIFRLSKLNIGMLLSGV